MEPNKRKKKGKPHTEDTKGTKDGVGRLYPPLTMFLRHAVGTAENGALKYEMAANYSDMAPLIKSEKTGAWFALSWSGIIDLAVAAGIDDPAKVPSKKSAIRTPQSAIAGGAKQ